MNKKFNKKRFFNIDITGDQEALNLWKKFRELSIDNLKRIYQVKSISFIVAIFS